MVTVLAGGRTADLAGSAAGEALWLNARDVAAQIGWEMKPEGLCHDDLCVPVPPDRAADFVRGDTLNIAEFWRRLDWPVLHDARGETWVLGENEQARQAQLLSLQAPDFTLPDLEGRQHRLADYLGRKIFLVTWASW